MNIELTANLKSRAAKHAALADPMRLRFVDLLTLGDLSPTELQERVGISSNLLAHHLNVLESEGMIVRSKSQGDRRRSYVHLIADALVDVGPNALATAHRIVFVCTGNSARSQLAAALWERASNVPAISAGTHPADRINPGAVAAAKRNGLALPSIAPRSLEGVLRDDDFVVTVCDRAHEELDGVDSLHWAVPDPVLVATTAAFDSAYVDIAHRIRELAPRLHAA